MTTRPASASGPLAALARCAVTQPIAEPVPADDARFLATKGDAKLAWRVLRRRAEVAFSGQKPRLVERIDPAWRRAVWFHAEAPQIGDALMDLAARSLLAESGIGVDLVAPPATAALFRGDRWLGRVTDDAGTIAAGEHDFAIVDSHSWRALQAKRARVPRLPWVSIHGEYLAYDFHRGTFTARRLAALLATTLDAVAERRHARQKLAIGASPTGSIPTAAAPLGRGTGPPRIALALGGVRAERSYRHWPAVASELARCGWNRFTLLGSDNGSAVASAVRAALAGSDVHDLVGRTDLHGTQRALAEGALALCADGGLLHLACTTTTPIVALFDASVEPAWRLPVDLTGTALRAPVTDVSAIEPGAVVAAALDLLRVSGSPSAGAC